MPRFIYCLLLGIAIFPAGACRSQNASEKLAEVDGTVITRSEVEVSGGKALSTMRQQLYQLERQKLDEYIGASLLGREAKKRSISVSSLMEQEVNAKVAPVSEEEIRSFYESNKSRIGVELAKVHDQIRDYLREQRIAARKSEYFNTLRSKVKITTYLKPPPIRRADVLVNGAPFKGAEKANVTIVKFEDFQCPYCKAVQPTVNELLKRYDGKIRLVHKDLPLDAIHPHARQAAEAARCAADQGKFWEYHDILYANSTKLALEDLKGYATQMRLDVESFRSCYNSGKVKGVVEKDLMEATQLGLTGTPAFFINGREISGALPIESFAAIIDEELGLAK